MYLVDVHAHMDFEEFFGKSIDKDAVIKMCMQKNVVAIVANGVDSASNRKILELAQTYSLIKPALGIYPMHCLEMIEAGNEQAFHEEIRFIDECIREKQCIAIGEVGLEYKEIVDINDEKKNIQKSCLAQFCMLAKKHNIPIILHSRGAELELIEFLESQDMKHQKVVMHCFSGRKHHVQRIIQNGWLFSIPCTIVRLTHFQDIVKQTPLHQLLTETDTPYLSPEPGTINAPYYVAYTVKKIAQLKNLTEEETANVLYNNYQRLFL